MLRIAGMTKIAAAAKRELSLKKTVLFLIPKNLTESYTKFINEDHEW